MLVLHHCHISSHHTRALNLSQQRSPHMQKLHAEEACIHIHSIIYIYMVFEMGGGGGQVRTYDSSSVGSATK